MSREKAGAHGDIYRRFRALRGLEGHRFGPFGAGLCAALWNRLGDEVAEKILAAAPELALSRILRVDVPAKYGYPGRICPDGRGGAWILTFDPSPRAPWLLRLDARMRLEAVRKIHEPGGTLLHMAKDGPCWFDSSTRSFVGLNGDVGLDFSGYGGLLGDHVVASWLLVPEPDEKIAVFSTADHASQIFLHVKGPNAKVFGFKGLPPVQAMVLSDGVPLIALNEHAVICRLDITSETLAPLLDFPLSCLLNSMAAGRQGRTWCLVRGGDSLVVLKGNSVASANSDLMRRIGAKTGASVDSPMYMAVDERDGGCAVMLSDIGRNRIYCIEFDILL